MTSTQTRYITADAAQLPAFILMEIFPKEGRKTEDFCTIGGGRVKRVGQLAHKGKTMTRKAKAEKRADSERRIAARERDERRMLGLETYGRSRRTMQRFVQRDVVVDYRRNGCIDTSMRTTVTVECKVRKQTNSKH